MNYFEQFAPKALLNKGIQYKGVTQRCLIAVQMLVQKKEKVKSKN